MCKTRWSEKDISYEQFYQGISHMAKVFELINGTRPEMHNYSETYTYGSNAKSKKDASLYLSVLKGFEFAGIFTLPNAPYSSKNSGTPSQSSRCN